MLTADAFRLPLKSERTEYNEWSTEHYDHTSKENQLQRKSAYRKYI